jgi:hemerythrin
MSTISLQWSTSHAVFVEEIDDEHQEIFRVLSELESVLSNDRDGSATLNVAERLSARVVEHFAHEERLMRAARYDSMRWHKKSHDAAARIVKQLVARVEHGEVDAGTELVEYLTGWLTDHAQVADKMMGAFLRNHRRGLGKLTFRAGTRPMDSCTWVNAKGEAFDPRTGKSGS